MVLSGTNTTSSISSIVNQNQGGGPKKAGLVSQVGHDAYAQIHLGGVSNDIRFGSHSLASVSITRFPNTVSSRPIGSRPMNFH
jgi:hypothetical protein